VSADSSAAPGTPVSPDRLEAFLGEMASEFPRFRVIAKSESRLSAAIDIALRILTLNQQRQYMTHYYTVIGDTLYVPPGWDERDPDDRVITLRHERVHLRQRRRYTMPGMTFLYLIPFFPLGLAYGRARIEWEAYCETIRATAEIKGRTAARSQSLRDHILGRFTGPDYGWMWPFRGMLERWYDEALDEIAP
jgi:hypothetical protein